MGIVRRILAGIRVLLRRDVDESAVADEVRHYMDEAATDLIRQGMTPTEARRTVRQQYGDGVAAREEVRSSGWEHGIEVLVSDVKLSARRLRRSPGFTTVVVVTLGLGIGSATAVFSAVGPVLFGGLPYPDADRLVSIADRSGTGIRWPSPLGPSVRFRTGISRSITWLSQRSGSRR